MNFSRLPLTVLLTVAIIAGCGRPEQAETTSQTDVNETTKTITFGGDFQGPLGLQLWSVRDYAAEDLAGTLDRVARMGFREVELAGTYGMEPGEFLPVLQASGLDATAMHAPYERFRDSLETVLDEAVALGVESAGVAWIPHEDGAPFTDEMARSAAADFNRWGAAARERGIQFFYHVHGYEYRPGPDGETPFDVMVAETGAEDVKFEMDVFWVTHAGTDPVALLRKYPDRWSLVHIKDMRSGTPTSDYSGHASSDVDVPVGTGMIDYPEVLAAAREVGVARYYIEDESDEPLENIPKSIAYLKEMAF